MSKLTARVLTIFALALTTAVLAVTPGNALIVDLTSAGATGSIGDAFFQQISDQSTGTGVIDPFVRMQANGTEQGFNTDWRPLTGDLADVNSSAQFTHSTLVSDFGVVTDPNGRQSLRFLLDINQTRPGSLLSLDQMKIYTAAAPDISSLSQLSSQGTLLYDMDAAGDNWVKMDFALNPGSGGGDMLAYVPVSLFAGLQNQYLYLYSQFGTNHATNDGFEEWARIDGEPPVDPIPEPATLLLLGMGMAGAAAARRRRKN